MDVELEVNFGGGASAILLFGCELSHILFTSGLNWAPEEARPARSLTLMLMLMVMLAPWATTAWAEMGRVEMRCCASALQARFWFCPLLRC